MAVSGSWAQGALWYTGAEKWGSGVNPVHEVRDQGRGRQYDSKLGLNRGPEDHVAPVLADESDWGYCDGDYYGTEPDQLRAVPSDHPGWGSRYDRSGIPANWPETGERQSADESAAWRSVVHGSAEEIMHTINVPTGYGGISGGWTNKARSYANEPVTSDPSQYEVNTSMRQGPSVAVMRNDRAVARGTDVPRHPIMARVAGMIARNYARDFEQGGGPAAPRMAPFQQSELKRPFYFRAPGLPPSEDHFVNTMEGRKPLVYVPSDNPYPGADATSSGSDNWGYSAGDFYG